MTRLSILLCAATFACAATGAARAETSPSASSWDPDGTAPTAHDVAAAAARARASHCRTPSCKAIITIHELVRIALYEIGDANGGASLYGNRPRIAGRRVNHVLLDHPELYGPVCAMGVKLLSHVRPDSGEIFIPVTLLVHGVDIDLRDHGHCAQDLVAALPRDPGNDQIRINARDLCVAGDEDHPRPKAACAVLVEGVDEKH